MKTIARLLLCLIGWGLTLRSAADLAPGEPHGRFRLAITAPPTGSQVEAGVPISIRAVAVDRLDAVYSLDFFADGVRIGTSTIATLVALPPGTPVHHEWIWQDALPGTHVLEVRIPDPGVAAVSPPVTIHVGRPDGVARVHLLQPADLSEFRSPASVELVAEAVDPNGLLNVVEFLANGTLVGTSVVDFCPPCNEPPCPLGPCILPPAGMPLIHRVVWERPPEGWYSLEARALRADGDAVVSEAVHIVVHGGATAAALDWESPPTGSVWSTPGEVPLEITAVDPDGEIRRVEFFAGDSRIGVSEILTREVEIPGRPRSHRMVWNNPPAGPHSLQARATSRAGVPVTSSLRSIEVQGLIRTPVVWVETVDGEAVEGNAFTDGADGPADVLRFRIHRRGGPERDLQVFYQMEGEARSGEDYPAPAGSVSLPAGSAWADVVIQPLDEGLTEGDERVVLSLVPSPTMGPVDPYLIDPQRGRARGVIRDAAVSVPVVTVQLGRPYAIEGDGLNRAEWVLQRQGDASRELHVLFAVGGQAVRGADYRLVRNPCDFCLKVEEEIAGDSVVLHAGESWVTIGAIGVFDGMLDMVEPVLESIEFQVLTPPIPAVVGARPPYVAGAPDRVVAQVVERRVEGEAELVIIQPAAGAILPAGIANEVRALGVDPQGSIRRMELSANGVLVGVSEITTEEVDVPGRLREHRFQWLVSDAAQAGTYTLEVLASDASGQQIRSPGVPVTVSGGGPELPVITIAAGKSTAFEQGDSRSRTGTFVLHRKGDTLKPLTVFALTGGSAHLGTDYRWSNGPGLDPTLLPPIFGAFLPVTFEEGAGDTTLALTALPDDLPEGPESVRLEVIAPPILAVDVPGNFPWPFPSGYVVGEPRVAEVLIEDADISAPSVRILQPGPEARFAAGQDIEIVAVAVHPEAGIHGIQFLADGQVIGVDEYCCEVCDCAGPIPGQPFTGRFVWRGAPVGTHVLVARPLLGLNRILESAPVTIQVVEGSAARLEILSPLDGAVLALGRPVVIDTLGQDPAGLVSQVEFFANDQKIGETCFLCAAFGNFPPGTPLHNQIEWTPREPGDFVLTAIGQFGPDRRIASPPVKVTVRREIGPAQITIVAPRDGEQVAAGVPVTVTAVGVGRYGGITDVQLLVDGQPAGESRLVFLRPPEADEEVRHSFEVTFSPGPHVLVVQDLTDPAVISPPVTVVAGQGTAGITWIAPQEGAEFLPGQPIVLEVQATDPNGLPFLVEFFANERRIGESLFECPQCRLRPGAVIPHRFVWEDAPSGRQVLTARAVGADGTVIESPARRITVRPDGPQALEVVRHLPDAYEAGKPFPVRLVVTPGAGVAAYVIEEVPPFALPAPGIPGLDSPFWNVVNVSDGGALDPLTGKVKFGPYVDGQARTLTYELVPNMTVEVAHFGGVGVADGTAVPIGGDQELRAPVRHPADREPGDDSLSAAELTAYAAAWQREQPWPAGPNPIPVDYVTRAAALWKGGERYVFDPLAGPPPFCWSNGAVDGPAADQASTLPLLGGFASRIEELLPEGGTRVTLQVVPAPGTRAFAVEEHVGTGAGASGVTLDGVPGPGGTLRWGPFFGASPVEVAYVTVAGGSPGIRGGVASFDGQSVVIHGGRVSPGAVGPRLIGVDPLHDGSRLVTLESVGVAPEDFELEVSTDLRSWTPVGRFSSGGAAGFIRDAGAGESGVRFYRAVGR